MRKSSWLPGVLILVLTATGIAAQGKEPSVIGTWRLIAFEGEFKDTGDKIYD